MNGWPVEEVEISRASLFERIGKHQQWLQGDFSSPRLYLAHKDLSSMGTIEGIDFSNSDFVFTNCEGVEFRNCNFTNANFRKANLTNAKFIECDLGYSNFLNATLTSIDLTGSYLYCTVGNGREIKNFHTGPLFLTYTSHVLQIDCIIKSLSWWENASVSDIEEEINGLGQTLEISWSGFMSAQSVHERLGIMFGLINNAPAKASINTGV